MINKEILNKLQQQNEKSENIENRFKNLGERILAETENLTINEIESSFEESETSPKSTNLCMYKKEREIILNL